MGQQGLKLLNAFLVNEGTGNTVNKVYNYVFRKEFSKEEVVKRRNNNLSLGMFFLHEILLIHHTYLKEMKTPD